MRNAAIFHMANDFPVTPLLIRKYKYKQYTMMTQTEPMTFASNQTTSGNVNISPP